MTKKDIPSGWTVRKPEATKQNKPKVLEVLHSMFSWTSVIIVFFVVLSAILFGLVYIVSLF
tara:strand:+ start:1390 stop:1572 length:183 start_codon:yes stop_codon:yes gene_type:complete